MSGHSDSAAERERILRSARRCRRASMALVPLGVVVLLLALALGDYAAAATTAAAVVALVLIAYAQRVVGETLEHVARLDETSNPARTSLVLHSARATCKTTEALDGELRDSER